MQSVKINSYLMKEWIKKQIRKEEKTLNKRRWLLIITLLLVLISLPSIYDRWDAEVSNDTYELIIPYDDIADLTLESEVSIDETLTSLKEAGLNTISITPDTLSEWERRDIVSIYKPDFLADIQRFNFEEDNLIEDKAGFYVTVPEESYYDNKIKQYFDPLEITIGNQPLYFIKEDSGIDLDESKIYSYMGYNQNTLEQINDYDFSYILRVDNEEEYNEEIVSDLVEMKEENLSHILFSGQEVIGFPEVPAIKTFANQLDEAGFDFYTIEFANQHGLTTIAREVDYDFNRLHSLDLDRGTTEVNIDRVLRAVKERNIRSVFIRIPSMNQVSADERLETTTTFLTGVTKQMPEQFKVGQAVPFKEVNTSLFMQIVLLLAGILFTFLAAEIFKNNKLRIASLVFMGGLALLYLVLGVSLILKAFALVIAIATPIYAVLASIDKPTTSIANNTLRYLKAIGISLIGITIVTGLLNGSAFITGFEQFRGVILVYTVPIIFVAVYVIWNLIFGNTINDLFKKVQKVIVYMLQAQVKYWHIIVLLIAGAGLYYYISRSGNAGTALDIELVIRQKLEEVLYIRPRTKEFLIGFPMFILAMHVMGINQKWGELLLIPGVIGFLSIMNTFTHFHIPIYVSLLRTAYSLVFGYIIGLILIYLFNICYRIIFKLIKAR